MNYPKWEYGVYPSRPSVERAIKQGVQYLCEENGQILGAFVLNDDPQGVYEKGQWTLRANDELIASLASNLLRNAYIHSLPHSAIDIYIKDGVLSIANTNDGEALDASRLFDRFYRGHHGKKNSNGLGLSIVKAICESSKLAVSYTFKQGKHIFTVSR